LLDGPLFQFNVSTRPITILIKPFFGAAGAMISPLLIFKNGN
jgi:hypothetical protein